eukprot:COSAG05_NODE_2771_length_2663_cov_1.765601_2_plen_93_part_00
MLKKSVLQAEKAAEQQRTSERHAEAAAREKARTDEIAANLRQQMVELEAQFKVPKLQISPEKNRKKQKQYLLVVSCRCVTLARFDCAHTGAG